MLNYTRRGWCTNHPWNIDSFFYFSAFNIPGYIIFRTPMHIFCGCTSFSLPLTHCTSTCLLLACHPRNLRGIFTDNTCVLFTLGTRHICYFCSQYPTSAAALADVKMGLQVNIQEALAWCNAKELDCGLDKKWLRIPVVLMLCHLPTPLKRYNSPYNSTMRQIVYFCSTTIVVVSNNPRTLISH